MAASGLIGTKVRNANKESIGKIDDIYLDKDAKVTDVVISVGGFLGVGSKDVAVKWSDITFAQEDNSVVLTTSLTKDALTALPDYTEDRPPQARAAGRLPPRRRPGPRLRHRAKCWRSAVKMRSAPAAAPFFVEH